MEHYRQTTAYTCAASSLLMLLHDRGLASLSRDEEFGIWHASANLPVRASSIYGLALVAKARGLSPRIVLGEREFDYPDFEEKGYGKKEIDEAKYSSRLYARRAQEAGVPIEQKDVGVDDVISLLHGGHELLLRVDAGVFRGSKSTSKYVLVIMHDGEYVILDPRYGELVVGEEDLGRAMGSLQSRKGRDVRMIVFGSSPR